LVAGCERCNGEAELAYDGSADAWLCPDCVGEERGARRDGSGSLPPLQPLLPAQRESGGRGGRGGSDSGGRASGTSPLSWLRKATQAAVIGWLAREVPSTSKAEAVAKLELLEARVAEEVPDAAEALALIRRVLAQLSAARDDRPWRSPPGDLLEVSVEAWQTIIAWGSPTDPRRFLASFGDAVVRLQRFDNGALGTTVLDVNRMVNLLARVARWGRCDKLMLEFLKLLAGALSDERVLDLAYSPCPPPRVVAQNLLADPERPLPVLERVVEVPVLAPDGSVHEVPGYDRSSRCFYAPAPELDVPPVPEYPTPTEVARARTLILDELLADFPFVSDSERAHAVAFMLLPFVRVLIDGPTPLHLFEAPTPGTGKTLLVEALAVPALGGRRLAMMGECRDPDEWRKRLTAKLRSAPAFLVIDNLRRLLDSSALAMTITAGEVEDRLLGVSETVVLPVRCALAATANNPTLSDEMTRRSVRIRLDSGEEFPERRTGFRHADLLAWAWRQRGELVWATLVLARAWVARGSPGGPETPLGGFEEWTRVVGGILHHAEIPGLLANADELRAESQDTSASEFLAAAHEQVGSTDFMTAELVELGRLHLHLGDVGDAQTAQRLGRRMGELVDRPIGGLVLRRGTRGKGRRHWHIESVLPDSDSGPYIAGR
jgi:putative DNA primase/helicase